MRHLNRIIFTIIVAVALSPGLLLAGDGQIHRNAHAIPNEYIVVLNDDTPRGEITGLVNRLAKQYGGDVSESIGHADFDLLKRTGESASMS